MFDGVQNKSLWSTEKTEFVIFLLNNFNANPFEWLNIESSSRGWNLNSKLSLDDKMVEFKECVRNFIALHWPLLRLVSTVYGLRWARPIESFPRIDCSLLSQIVKWMNKSKEHYVQDIVTIGYAVVGKTLLMLFDYLLKDICFLAKSLQITICMNHLKAPWICRFTQGSSLGHKCRSSFHSFKFSREILWTSLLIKKSCFVHDFLTIIIRCCSKRRTKNW